MTKEELITLLRNPDQTGQAVDELNRLVEENLYFHAAHQLYIKGLQQTDKEKMELQLSVTSLNVRDRGVLYNYMNHPSTFRRQLSPDNRPKKTAEPFVPDHSFIAPDAEIPPIPEPLPPLQNLLSMDEEWQKPEEQSLDEEQVISDHQLMDIIRRQLEQIVPSEVEKTTDYVVTDEEKKGLSSDNDLIDAFLQSNPKIVPDENIHHVDLSESMQESLDIATDTLAEIYAEQGYVDKAIEIYEHLILKYPEKHIYFAAQIERLKNSQ